MNNRQRILKLLAGEKPDRVPWFADLDYWYRGLQYKGDLPEKYEGDGYFQLNQDLGTGFYLQGYFPFAEEHEHVTIEEDEKDNKKITTVKTPHGSLHQVYKFLLNPELEEQIARDTPLGRVGYPEELADVFVFWLQIRHTGLPDS